MEAETRFYIALGGMVFIILVPLVIGGIVLFYQQKMAARENEHRQKATTKEISAIAEMQGKVVELSVEALKIAKGTSEVLGKLLDKMSK